MAQLAYEERLLWEDPDPNTPGLLLSDRIQFYADRVHLIQPLKPENLRPASYDLTLGKDFYKDRRLQHLNDGEILTLPPNDIVFVITDEVLQIPYYMIGRFNLTIGLVYQGILLGTGPQVDPGYRGPLYCPLYNLSNQEVPIIQGQRFATIDFIKTTPFAEADTQRLAQIASETDLYIASGTQEFRGSENLSLKLFPRDKKDRPLSFRLPKYTITSTLVDLRNKVEQIEGTLRTVQLVNYLAIAVVAAVVISLAALTATSIFYNQNWIKGLAEEIRRLCSMIPRCK